MRFAIIDIGTNTILLLVVESLKPGAFTVLEDHHAIGRLGEGVDQTRNISPGAFERFVTIAQEELAICSEYKVNRIIAVATSALRDAKNKSEIVARTKSILDLNIELLSGEDESRWTYRGAIAGHLLPHQDALCVIDIGGGSTEISHGTGEQYTEGISLDMGAVRMTERAKFLPPPERTMYMIDNIQTLLQTLPMNHTHSRCIAVAGTPTSLAAMDLQLEHFDAKKINGHVLTLGRIAELREELFELSEESLLTRYKSINAARADILPAGTLILEETMRHLGINEVTVSTRGLRYGIAIRELERSIHHDGPWTID